MSLILTKSIFSILLVACYASANILQSNLLANNLECSNDPYRPRFHFSPSKNWINDPNGMVYYDGKYHLFYQYHPSSMVWGPMHWGHAVSSNLITWKELDIALKPDEHGDIFSGSAVVDTTNTSGFKTNTTDPIVAIYTSASGTEYKTQTQSLAYSLDGGLNFKKYEKNPVLVDDTKEDFRDPKVFFHDNRWIMSLAVKDTIEFYASKDLKSWTKQSSFGKNPEFGEKGGVWECPDLIPLNVDISEKLTIEQWVLLVSINPGGPNQGSATQYFVGNFSADNPESPVSFHSNSLTSPQWLDWGPDNYAGVTFSNDPKGRYIYIGWMSNWLYANYTPTSSWRGQMTIPRQLSLQVKNHEQQEYQLVSTPIEELVQLRNTREYVGDSRSVNVVPRAQVSLKGENDFASPLMEVNIEIEIEKEVHFAVCTGNSDNEEVCFGLNRTKWFLDRSRSGNTKFSKEFANTAYSTAQREFNDEKIINIRMFLDVSSIEVFTDNGITTMTALHYPSKPLQRLYIRNLDDADSAASVKVNRYDVWGLQCWYSNENDFEPPASVSTTPPPSKGTAPMERMSFGLIICLIFLHLSLGLIR